MAPTILIIDDDPAVRGSFSLILEDAGYDVRVAGNGLNGLAMAEEISPDLIFLDLRMPGLDGVETLRRLKAVNNAFNVYVVTAFAHEYMEQLKTAHDEGLAFQIANKPLSLAQIKHIAGTIGAAPHPEADTQLKLQLTLYIVSLNDEFRRFIERLNAILAATYAPGDWKLEIIEVLYMPEKALANDIFATPMLVREVPEPVLRVLGDLSKMPAILGAITSRHDKGSDTIVM